MRYLLSQLGQLSFAVKKHAGGERCERCQRQIQRAERVAAVDKIEDQHKPEDFIGHRNRDVLGKVKTTGVAGGLHWPYKGLLLAYALRRLNDSPTAHSLLAAPSRGRLYYLPLPTGSPVNGSLNSLRLI